MDINDMIRDKKMKLIGEIFNDDEIKIRNSRNREDRIINWKK
jgi:hypothetical protein